MDRVDLDPVTTDAGLMERVMLHETKGPGYQSYDQADSLKAMRLMRQVFQNRLRHPGLYGAPHAKSVSDIIKVRVAFGNFADAPDIPEYFMANVSTILQVANNTGDPRRDRFAQHVRNAIAAATEIAPPADAIYPGVSAWRTAGASAPGRSFRAVVTLQNNTFYAAQ